MPEPTPKLTLVQKKPLLTDQLPDIEKRNLLADLLAEAAEFEHSVLCLYLFAAFSLKKRVDEGVSYSQMERIRNWEATILTVSRQEMEHLTIVNNILTAIGESSNLRRPDYPFRSPYHAVSVSFSMEPFSMETLKRFISFEMPDQISPETQAYLESIIPGFKVENFDGALQLYQKIQELITELPESLLFIGPVEAQYTTDEIVPTKSILGVNLRGTHKYDTFISAVTDRKSALQCVTQIIDEGEGSPQEDAGTHFTRFLQIYQEYEAELKADPHFEPARPVVSNPKTASLILNSNEVSDQVHVIEHPVTNQVSSLFDLVYETQILLLQRYFLHAGETQAELDSLQYAAFFPLMTAMVRPLAEILTELPAYQDPARKETAGPSFTFARRLQPLPHKQSARKVLSMQLQLMSEKASALCSIGSFSPAIQGRLKMIQENMARTSMMFEQRLNIKLTHG